MRSRVPTRCRKRRRWRIGFVRGRPACPRASPRNLGNCNSIGESHPRQLTPEPEFSRRNRRRPHARAHTFASQRLDTYIVISIPNRNSTACGVSHVISSSYEWYGLIVHPMRGGSNQQHHETGLAIFMRVPLECRCARPCRPTRLPPAQTGTAAPGTGPARPPPARRPWYHVLK
jgi:hypothetical protein